MTESTELTCEVCHNEEAVGVAAVPGVPISVAYGRQCLTANAHPYDVVVANTAMVGGYQHAAEWWQRIVDDTLRHLGEDRGAFDARVREVLAEDETSVIAHVLGELPEEPEVFVNDYQVTRFPRDHGGARHFSMWVQYRGGGKWAITRYRSMSPYMTYDHDGVEDYDSGPFDPDGDDDAREKNRAWRERRRWDSAEDAIEFAKTLLPGLTCNGWTAEDVMQRDPTGDRT